jgi:hypothetical protein
MEKTVTLESSVCFSKSGVYNLNRYKLSLKTRSNKMEQIFSQFQHIIVIEDAQPQASQQEAPAAITS